MTLFTALVPECVAVGLTLSDKAEALRKISELAKTCPALANVSQADKSPSRTAASPAYRTSSWGY